MSGATQIIVLHSWDDVNIQLIQNDDRKEITRLYNMMYNWLIWKFQGDSDAISFVFLKIIKKIKTHYQPIKGLLSNFIYTIAINEHIEYCKRLIRERKKQQDNNITFVPLFEKYDVAEAGADNSNDVDLTEMFYSLVSFLNDNDKEFIYNYLNKQIIRDAYNRVRFFRIKSMIVNKVNNG